MHSCKLVLLVEDEDTGINETTVQNWKDEGFEVSVIPSSSERGPHTNHGYRETLLHIPGSFDDDDTYAIIAYGKAASTALEVSAKVLGKLCALIAYYPEKSFLLENPFLEGQNSQVHLEGSQTILPNCRHYVYADSEKGFADTRLDVYDKVAAGLAWSRTLATLRKGFDIEVDLEKIWDDHLALEFATKDADATMATMVAEPYVNHIPTMAGGIGYKDLHRFYRDYFIPGNPPSLKMKLLSRTVGTDRVVDEMYVSFEHTQIIPWLLPDVEPTNEFVEVALVAIVCIRGGKLYHEHIYWDQASVLVQIGLLSPNLMPNGKVSVRLPVVDGAGARKVVDEKSVTSNELIGSWW